MDWRLRSAAQTDIVGNNVNCLMRRTVLRFAASESALVEGSESTDKLASCDIDFRSATFVSLRGDVRGQKWGGVFGSRLFIKFI